MKTTETIYVHPMMDMSRDSMDWLKNEVAKATGIEVNPEPWEPKDLNAGCKFHVSESAKMVVVNAIHDLGDFECFKDEEGLVFYCS